MRSLRLILAAPLITGLLVGVTPPTEAATPGADTGRLTPRTTFTMAPNGSSGRTQGGEGIPNIDSVKKTIAVYYGDPGTGKADLSSSPYAAEMNAIIARQTRALKPRYDAARRKDQRPAIVVDVDDTTLLTYDLTAGLAHYTDQPALRKDWVTTGRFPATPAMVSYLRQAKAMGYQIFGITGRKRAYRDATLANLRKVGYAGLFSRTRLYTRWKAADQPRYVTCAKKKACTTVEYKAYTRKHIERSRHYTVITNIGDQWSDLRGGWADHLVKVPNPMYDISSPNLPGKHQPKLTARSRFTMAPDGSSGRTQGGEGIPNVDRVKKTIAVYYGDRGTGRADKKSSPYISEMRLITAAQRATLQRRYDAAVRRHQRPALIFDTDDTTLFTYDMEVAGMDFDFDPALQDVYVQRQRFAKTPQMVSYVNAARRMGYTIFGLTGRNDDQKAATLANLAKVGYSHRAFVADRFFTKWTGVGASQQPNYITCAAAKCTTVEYKSQTRRHIEQDLGYTIVANYGDQYSDLIGGYAQHTVKLPNPTYYLP